MNATARALHFVRQLWHLAGARKALTEPLPPEQRVRKAGGR